MAVKTPHGLTDRQTVQNIVLQGDKFGSLLSSEKVDKMMQGIKIIKPRKFSWNVINFMMKSLKYPSDKFLWKPETTSRSTKYGKAIIFETNNKTPNQTASFELNYG